MAPTARMPEKQRRQAERKTRTMLTNRRCEHHRELQLLGRLNRCAAVVEGLVNRRRELEQTQRSRRTPWSLRATAAGVSHRSPLASPATCLGCDRLAARLPTTSTTSPRERKQTREGLLSLHLTETEASLNQCTCSMSEPLTTTTAMQVHQRPRTDILDNKSKKTTTSTSTTPKAHATPTSLSNHNQNATSPQTETTTAETSQLPTRRSANTLMRMCGGSQGRPGVCPCSCAKPDSAWDTNGGHRVAKSPIWPGKSQ